jgi:recA bacterial DNA recombination protein
MASTATAPIQPAHALQSSAATTLDSLRALLPPPLPVAPGLPTGLESLDAALASEGLPRGRLTEVVGATGKLTLLRQVVDAAVARGEWVAYIDASRTLAPRDWADLEATNLWIVRPPSPANAAWCADVLLRSAAFGLVVLDSAPPISRAVAVRLTGLARESNAAFVVVGEGGGGIAANPTKLGGAVRLRVSRRRQRLRIAIEKGGRAGVGRMSRLQQVVEVRCANGVARRLCTYPEVPDRRGAARPSTGKGKPGRRAATPAYGGHDRGMLQPC